MDWADPYFWEDCNLGLAEGCLQRAWIEETHDGLVILKSNDFQDSLVLGVSNIINWEGFGEEELSWDDSADVGPASPMLDDSDSDEFFWESTQYLFEFEREINGDREGLEEIFLSDSEGFEEEDDLN